MVNPRDKAGNIEEEEEDDDDDDDDDEQQQQEKEKKVEKKKHQLDLSGAFGFLVKLLPLLSGGEASPRWREIR